MCLIINLPGVRPVVAPVVAKGVDAPLPPHGNRGTHSAVPCLDTIDHVLLAVVSTGPQGLTVTMLLHAALINCPLLAVVDLRRPPGADARLGPALHFDAGARCQQPCLLPVPAGADSQTVCVLPGDNYPWLRLTLEIDTKRVSVPRANDPRVPATVELDPHHSPLIVRQPCAVAMPEVPFGRLLLRDWQTTLGARALQLPLLRLADVGALGLV
mmetsp:Transcript_152964/g.267323  ORF Transcript_152964/g.267323 Transcript_152964/m.267323 type:complete len:213 (+) Transcript_152964:1961-2599(+)